MVSKPPPATLVVPLSCMIPLDQVMVAVRREIPRTAQSGAVQD